MPEKDTLTYPWFMERRYLTLITVLAFVILSAIAFFICYRHHTINTELILKEDRSAANLLSLVMDEHFKKIVSVMESYSNRPLLLQAVKDKNVEKAGEHLSNLAKSNPDIDIVVISDKWGTPWAASYPGPSPVIGKNFAHRDWYKGVSKEWKANISDVVLRVVEEKDLAVQISVPCINEKGEVIGILVNTQRTVGLNRLFKPVPLDSGTFITVTDRKGQIVYDSRDDVEKEIKPYPFHAGMKKAIAAKNNTFAVDDPDLGGGSRYISFASVVNIGWTVFVERNKRSIFLSETGYYIQVAAIALLLFLTIILSLFYSRKQVMAQQIMAQLEAEKIVRAGEERYRELFDNMSSGVAIYEVRDNGNDFIFKDFNKTGERLDGDWKEDIIGKSIYQARPGITEFGLLDVFKRVWKSGIPEHYPATFYEDDRLHKWFENYVYKLPSGDIVAVYDDITERKQMEEEKRRLEERSRKVVEDIFRFIPEGVLVFSRKMELLRQNQAFRELASGYAKRLGFAEDELENLIVDKIKAAMGDENIKEIKIKRKHETGEQT
jgi:PAS domain-containing protein